MNIEYTHTRTYARTSVRLRGPVGVGWCVCEKANIINHVHAHLVGLGGVSVGGV